MKNILKLSALLILFNLAACKDDENDLSLHDKNVNMITSTSWGDATVTHADGDLSDQYEDFVMAFTKNSSTGFDGTYVIANGGYAFSEAAGNWKFSDDLTQIILDSGKEMDFELDENSLQLDFTVTSPGGRAAGLSGHFIFDLKPL